MNERDYLISCEALGRRIGESGFCIVDCRFDLGDPAAGYAQYLESHIPGAVFADLERDLSGAISPATGRHPLPAADALAATLGRLGIDNATAVICYDQSSGALAARLWWLLRWLGHDNACLLDGGIARWEALGLPLESSAVTRKPVDFHGSPDERRVVHTQEIVDAGAEQLVLVDARDEARFAGRSEPIDPVAGHIPGALNVPYTASLDQSGSWKSQSALRQLWEENLGPDFDSEWCVMCGSGVTACHLVTSALIAGLPEPRVYVGSWSEWIRDPERAIIGLD
jgi:thiosulfate/3-mercaptopyruvate sulfurtransferase